MLVKILAGNRLDQRDPLTNGRGHDVAHCPRHLEFHRKARLFQDGFQRAARALGNRSAEILRHGRRGLVKVLLPALRQLPDSVPQLIGRRAILRHDGLVGPVCRAQPIDNRLVHFGNEALELFAVGRLDAGIGLHAPQNLVSFLRDQSFRHVALSGIN
jgi:hypothetical protein